MEDKGRHSRLRNTIVINIGRMTRVRINVARFEGMSLTPIFAKTAVSPANKAEPIANNCQFIISPPYLIEPLRPLIKQPALTVNFRGYPPRIVLAWPHDPQAQCIVEIYSAGYQTYPDSADLLLNILRRR